jgi:hypothetical protein
MTLKERLYKVVRSQDSLIPIILRDDDGELEDSSSVTRVDLLFKREGYADYTISSSQDPTWFTLASPAVVNGVDLNIVLVNLRQIDTTPTDGRYTVDIFVWDAVDTNGRLRDTIEVEVRPAVPAAT